MPSQNTESMHHVRKLKEMLTEVRDHARQDVNKVPDPKAQALFETTAEVLNGLATAYEHFEQGTEAAWKQAAGGSRP
jgi:hypothetical protein